ncbi:MAG TPA: hypothetical protein VFI72_01740 [Candidatus Angelobacter sp.]|nr:hypothetical protein [Candidatus Angelobacter sp.]
MQRRYFALIFSGALLLTLFSQIAVAQGNSQGKGKGKNKHQQMVEDDDAGSYQRGGVRIVFSTHDRDMIRDYYRDSYSNLPPGLAKRGGNLPPGLQKHLERDGQLPPGLQKRVQPFPVELERRLPPLPDGYRRVTLGVDILILDRRTQRIMDIVHDILRP